jgi:hypothetical protein
MLAAAPILGLQEVDRDKVISEPPRVALFILRQVFQK